MKPVRLAVFGLLGSVLVLHPYWLITGSIVVCGLAVFLHRGLHGGARRRARPSVRVPVRRPPGRARLTLTDVHRLSGR